VGAAADNTKTPPLGGGGGRGGARARSGVAADDTKTPPLRGHEGSCEGVLCDRSPTSAPSIGNLLGFSYG
jgi:hypothetical protein